MRIQRAFTLIEVMLSMAIAIMIVGAITMAVDFHLRVLESGRSEVEQAQLARAILRRIADDLRSTVRFEAIDVESMLSQASANSGAAGAAAGAAGGPPEGGGGPSPRQPSQPTEPQQPPADPATADSSESQNQDLSESAVITPEPGLYGNLYELQVDVSRLPRIDQYERMLASPDGRPTDVVSDVKTVAYYVLDGSTGVTGLVRREMDRAATSWAVNNSGIEELGLYEELLAPEVAALEFRYFDGVEWLDEWDSTAAKNLPVAVEISLAVAARTTDRSEVAMMDLASLSAEPGYRVYRLLVHLPAAKTLAQQEAEAAAAAAKAAEEAAAGTSTGGTGTSSETGTPP